MNEQQLEAEIQAKGLRAPRVHPRDIDEQMAKACIQYYVFPTTTVTVCCVELENGFCLVGKSAAVSSENFDKDIGRAVALRDAREKLWELLGFHLKSVGASS